MKIKSESKSLLGDTKDGNTPAAVFCHALDRLFSIIRTLTSKYYISAPVSGASAAAHTRDNGTARKQNVDVYVIRVIELS